MLFFLQDTVQFNMKNFKKINELFFNITKQIYKRHDNNFLIILDNWKQIVGESLSSRSFPKKLNRSDASKRSYKTVNTHRISGFETNKSIILVSVSDCSG